jgi:hypothetical protein
MLRSIGRPPARVSGIAKQRVHVVRAVVKIEMLRKSVLIESDVGDVVSDLTRGMAQ